MSFEVNLSFEEDHVLCKTTGEDSYQASLEMWKEITQFCIKVDCYNVLGIQDNTPLNSRDAIDHAKIFNEVAIDFKYRIAWVEYKKESLNKLLFAEYALKQQGISVIGMVTNDLDKAKNWLLTGSVK